MSAFLDPLDVEEIDDVDFRIVDHPFRYQSDLLGYTVVAPVGFETDFASTWSHKYAKKSGVIHDRLYFTAEVSRDKADAILKEAMIADGEWALTAYLYWIGVRVAGWVAWQKHRDAGDGLTPSF